jgi:hypothetical protein
LTDRLTHRNRRCPDADPALCGDGPEGPEPYEYWRHGTAPLGVRPSVYVAPQTHASIAKNARNLIGAASIRQVAMSGDLRLDPEALDKAMAADIASGNYLPFLVVGTVGATPSGIVDPLADCPSSYNLEQSTA